MGTRAAGVGSRDMKISILSARSPGAKFGLVGALGLLFGIPLHLVGALHWERQARSREVRQEVAARTGGPQTMVGPVLAVPYTYRRVRLSEGRNGTVREEVPVHRAWVVSPAQLKWTVDQKTQRLRRGIYQVPAHATTARFEARFDGFEVPELPDGSVIQWENAAWLLGVSDARSVGSLVATHQGSGALGFGPVPSTFQWIPWAKLSAPAGITGPDSPARLSGTLEVSGVEQLAFGPSGQQTELTWHSDWPHPSFVGDFVPVERNLDEDGFSARWAVSSIARGMGEVVLDPERLDDLRFGMRQVQPGDGYAQVARSLKYGLLFVAMVLATFLLVELTSVLPVHPAQYLLVGTVQVSFYLLLLASSEHVPVQVAYFLAAAAATGLTSVYALWTFGSVRFAGAVLGSTSAAYAFQYTLVQLEDHALLVGAWVVFGGLAALMYVTRRVRWYPMADLDPDIEKAFEP